MKELFTRLIKLTDSKENFFTECVVLTMQSDIAFGKNLIHALLGKK